MKHINIEQFSNGELTQQINREMEAVARNIADPNTEALRMMGTELLCLSLWKRITDCGNMQRCLR